MRVNRRYGCALKSQKSIDKEVVENWFSSNLAGQSTHDYLESTQTDKPFYIRSSCWIQEDSAMLYVIKVSHRGKAWGRCLSRFAGHGSNRATPPMRMMVKKQNSQQLRREQQING